MRCVVWRSIRLKILAEEWVLNLDGGSTTRSDQSQFSKRLVELSQAIDLPNRLSYCPPYHSRSNAIERCWAALEHDWNGARFDSVQQCRGRVI